MGTRTGNPTWEDKPSTASPISATALENIEMVLDNSVPLDTFPEEVRDLVGAALVAGANITITVNDPGDTITIAATVAAPPDASTTVKGIVELATNAETQAGTDTVRAVTPAGAAATYVPLATVAETIRDTMAAALVAGANITITPNDAGDTITIAATIPAQPDASTTVKGIVELATTAETQSGTDAIRAVTPQGAAGTYIPKSIINNAGDLIVGSGSDLATILPAGTSGDVLTVGGPFGIQWAPGGGGGGGASGAVVGYPGMGVAPDDAYDFVTETDRFDGVYQTPMKFTIPTAITIDAVAVDVTVSDFGATGYATIWSSDANGLPSTVLAWLEFDFSLGVTGITYAVDALGGIAMPAGVYWVGIAASPASTLRFRGCKQRGVNVGVSGVTASLAQEGGPSWRVQGFSGDIPGNAPENVTTLAEPNLGWDNVPWVALRCPII